MRTQFTPIQLSNPGLAQVERNLRACMHCGICTATCPTYVLLGDERDGPRGRIVMMQQMLEQGGAPSPETVLHVDRCLSCLSCRTACPSGVDYARLVDEARIHIETHFRRPIGERLLRRLIATLFSRPFVLRSLLGLARSFAPVAKWIPGRLGQMARKGSELIPPRREGVRRPPADRRNPVLLLSGCVQSAVAPEIDEAVTRLLDRRGCAAMPVSGCCGALAFHLGRKEDAKRQAKRMIKTCERQGADAPIAISATGCAAHLMEYPHLFLGEPEWKRRAEGFASRVRDVSALAGRGPASTPRPLRVAFHSACSAQNSLRLKDEVETMLRHAGFAVLDIPDGHLCCGSAGSYSLLQPDISTALRRMKLENIRATAPDVVATGNIGCVLQLSGPDAPPVLHYAELLDWAEGGPTPAKLRDLSTRGGLGSKLMP